MKLPLLSQIQSNWIKNQDEKPQYFPVDGSEDREDDIVSSSSGEALLSLSSQRRHRQTTLRWYVGFGSCIMNIFLLLGLFKVSWDSKVRFRNDVHITAFPARK